MMDYIQGDPAAMCLKSTCTSNQTATTANRSYTVLSCVLLLFSSCTIFKQQFTSSSITCKQLS